jgi:N-acyl-D-aspartate/D-glutamate deacylase
MLPAAGLCLLLSLPAADAPVQADTLIRGALICDGTGAPGFRGDVAIRGDRLVGVGTFAVAGRPRVFDGTGLVVAPGFIDLHTHSDRTILEPATRPNLNYLLQGVTTIVTGNCGFGPVDVGAYLRKIDAAGAGTNVAHQVPHNDLRQRVMGNANRRPTHAELEKMKALVDRGMRDGAFGMSTGLYYTPGSYTDLEELVELSRVVAEHGGFYASHMRDEGTGLLASVNETLTIGRRAGLPVHISHLKAYSKSAWGRADDAVALIEQARRAGQAVTADQYPYTASSTSLAADVIPARFREGTQKDLVARFDDPEVGPKVREAMRRQLEVCDGGRALHLAQYAARPDWQGKDLAAIARQEKKPVLDVVLDIERHGGAQIVNFSMQEEEVRLIMKQPFVATASDGGARVPDRTVPHPRNYGCFARKIGYYSIAEKLLPLEQAIRSCSGLPADILGLPRRGYLKAGYVADLVVFDPQTYRDRATFEKPHQYAAGVRWVFVNGKAAVAEGKYTGTLAGKALRHRQVGLP